MSLTDIASREEWAALEREFFERFGLNARVYDEKGAGVTGQALWCNTLCPAVKGSPSGLAAICSVANMALAAEAERGKATVIDACDAGLVKICVPVFQDGRFVGVLGGCGRLPEGGEVDGFLVAKGAGLPEEQVEALARDVPGISQEQAEAAARFLEERLAVFRKRSRG